LRRDDPIGIFDSGVGGLTVASEVMKRLPGEDIIYFGDTGRYPYGSRSPQIVRKFALEDVDFLSGSGIKAVVVACNTASSVALDVLRGRFTIPIMGVIEPGARAAVRATINGILGVIGTRATIKSGSYNQAIERIDPGLKVIAKPCPLFVALAEEGWTEGEAVRLIAQEYLATLKEVGVDVLVLGCTHYPLLSRVIGKVMGEDVTLIDSAKETSRELRDLLEREGLLNPRKEGGSCRFLVTDDPEAFLEVGRNFLKEKVTGAELVAIERLKGEG
jgi:glutamate racemase